MEEEAEYKSEYFLGEIFAITRASINHIKDEKNRWILEDLINMEDILTVRSVGVELLGMSSNGSMPTALRAAASSSNCRSRAWFRSALNLKTAYR